MQNQADLTVSIPCSPPLSAPSGQVSIQPLQGYPSGKVTHQAPPQGISIGLKLLFHFLSLGHPVEYFLLLRQEFLRANPVFIIRISPTNNPAIAKASAGTSMSRDQQPLQALSALLHLYSLKSPQNSKCKLFAANKKKSQPS